MSVFLFYPCLLFESDVLEIDFSTEELVIATFLKISLHGGFLQVILGQVSKGTKIIK